MHFEVGIVPNYDKIILVRDFDIHVCCPFFSLALHQRECFIWTTAVYEDFISSKYQGTC